MKIRRILPPAALCMISTTITQAAPNEVKPPPALAQGRFTGDRVTSTRASADVFQGAQRIASKGDRIQTIKGSPKSPVQMKLPWLHLSTQNVFVASGKSTFYFASESRYPKSKLKFTLAPRSGGAPVKVEAECYVGDITSGKVTLEDGVSGFYEDANGRHELKGDIVTLWAFDNAISIVQDGDITLSTPTVPAS